MSYFKPRQMAGAMFAKFSSSQAMTRLSVIGLLTVLLGLAPLTASAQLVFTKSFSDDAINVGDTTTLTFVIDNSDGLVEAEMIEFTDNFPVGLQQADPDNFMNGCGGGSSRDTTFLTIFTFLDAGDMCVVSIDLEAVSAGLQVNVTEDLTSSQGNSGPATDSIVVADAGAPLFRKSFAAPIIEINEVTTLTFTIDNTANIAAANSLAFLDVLPAGLEVAVPSNVANTCGGSVIDMTTSIDLSAGSVGAGATCTVSVDVIGVGLGMQDNTSGDLTSTAGSSGPALASVEVIDTPIPLFSKVFAAANLTVGDSTTLTFTIDNISVATDASALDFTDTLPVGLVVATPSNAATTCTGGTITAVDGAGTISYTGGTASANSQCEVTVDVEAVAAGLQANVTGDLTSTIGNSGPAMANVAVMDAGTPLFTKAFATDPLGENETTMLTFTIDNTANVGAANALDFTDNLPAGLVVTLAAAGNTTCAGSALTLVPGSPVISLTGGTVAGGAVCVVNVMVMGTTPGMLTNISGDLTSSLGNSGPAIDSVTVLDAPEFSKVFEASALSIGGTTVLTFNIINAASALDANNLDFTDTLPAGLILATPASPATTCTGGTVTAVNGTDTISYTGGSVAAGEVCNVTVIVEATALGMQNNLSGDLTSDLGNSGTAADSLDVIAPLEWNVVGPADWFDATNWLPNQVPNIGLAANINNGGISLVPDGSDRPEALNLNIGVDGGTGSMILEPDGSARIDVDAAVNIGVTFTGVATSTGLLQFGDNSFGAFNTQDNGPFRAGVSMADGDADGTFIHPDGFFSSGAEFTAVQIGVADAAGNANGLFMGDANTSGIGALNGPLQIGISNGSGNATGEISGNDIEDFSTADVGVANGTGTAVGLVDTGFSFEGAPSNANRGPVNIGVSNGPGSATGTVMQQLNVFGSITNDQWTEMNVGIANGTGPADGTMLNSNGITIPVINVGLNPGGGTAGGRIFVDHGLINTDMLTLGSGSVLEFTANATNRATGGGTGTMYAAANADVATLAGELIINLNFVPRTALQFEMVNSNSPTGITGLFDTVTVNNLPPGLSVVQSVQLDGGGDQQLVVDLTGVPELPAWINPNVGPTAGDWFDPANWSFNAVPTALVPAIIANGGESVLDSLTAPGPAIARDVIVAEEGNDGLLTSNGVDIDAARSFLISRVDPLNSAEQTATGTVVINNATVTVPPFNAPSSSVFDPGSVIAVGFAQGGGTAEASMEVNNGSLSAGDAIFVGAALPIAIDADPTSNGQLTFNGGGIGVSIIEPEAGEDDGDLFIAFAQDSNSGPGAQPTANASANINNASILGDIKVAFADAFTDDAISIATANTLVLSNLDITGDLDIANANAFDPDNSATSVAGNVTVTDVTFGPDSGTMDIGDADAGDPRAVANSTSTSVWTRVTYPDESADIEFGVADASDPDTVATVITTATINDSTFNVDDFEVGNGDARDNGIATSTTVVNLAQNTMLNGDALLVGITEADETSQASVDATLNITDSVVTMSEETTIGALEGDSTNALTSVTAAVNMVNSSLTTDMLFMDLPTTDINAGTVTASLTLNPSYISTNVFDVTANSSVLFGIEGLTRVTLGTVGNPDTYAAVDTGDGLIEGDITAEFDPAFGPPPGTHMFDLIVTGSSTALDDFTGTTMVNNLPTGFSIDFFGVVEDGGVDILRLQISGAAPVDLAVTKTDGVMMATQGDMLTYTIVVTNNGANTAFNATVSDMIPAGLINASWTCVPSAGGSCTAGPVNGDIMDTITLDSLATATYTLVATVDAGVLGTISNTATATIDGDANTANNSATDTTEIFAIPAVLSGTKTVDGELIPGGNLTYTITISNAGPGDQPDDPGSDEFTDVLPDGLFLTGASANSGTVNADIANNTVTWNGAIAAGGSVVITINASLSITASGEISNQGMIQFDADGDGVNDTTVPTDDPNSPEADDPTVFIVSIAVPALQNTALLIMIMLLLVVGARRYRNRS